MKKKLFGAFALGFLAAAAIVVAAVAVDDDLDTYGPGNPHRR